MSKITALIVDDEPNICKTFKRVLARQSVDTIDAENDIISNITINFNPDLNVENNTAQSNIIQSDDKGLYSVNIQPGSYDLVVNQTIDENNVTYRYIYQEKLEIYIGEGLKTLDILVTKIEES